MFCQNCGTEIGEGVKFCPNCGQTIRGAMSSADNSNETVILDVKGSLYGGGTGRIILTSKNIIWTKSKANFVAIGVLAFATKGDTTVSLKSISYIDTWTFLGGGGLQVHTINGKKYKFGFNSKKDRDKAMEYLKNELNI